MSIFKNFLKDESGASAAEYAIILAVIGGGLAIAVGTLNTAISGGITTGAGAI